MSCCDSSIVKELFDSFYEFIFFLSVVGKFWFDLDRICFVQTRNDDTVDVVVRFKFSDISHCIT